MELNFRFLFAIITSIFYVYKSLVQHKKQVFFSFFLASLVAHMSPLRYKRGAHIIHRFIRLFWLSVSFNAPLSWQKLATPSLLRRRLSPVWRFVRKAGTADVPYDLRGAHTTGTRWGLALLALFSDWSQDSSGGPGHQCLYFSWGDTSLTGLTCTEAPTPFPSWHSRGPDLKTASKLPSMLELSARYGMRSTAVGRKCLMLLVGI